MQLWLVFGDVSITFRIVASKLFIEHRSMAAQQGLLLAEHKVGAHINRLSFEWRRRWRDHLKFRLHCYFGK